MTYHTVYDITTAVFPDWWLLLLAAGLLLGGRMFAELPQELAKNVDWTSQFGPTFRRSFHHAMGVAASGLCVLLLAISLVRYVPVRQLSAMGHATVSLG